MKTMAALNIRLAIRNLVVATVISLVYLVGKHFQATHNKSSVGLSTIKGSVKTNNVSQQRNNGLVIKKRIYDAQW
jgi:hypothetical protein